MKRFDLQNYSFLNFMRYIIKILLCKKNFRFLYGRKKVVDIRKITLHFHKTLTLGIYSSNVNVEILVSILFYFILKLQPN